MALPAEIGHDLADILADPDDLAADLEADLADDAQDVPLGRRSLGPDDEVGAAEEEEMEGVVLHEKGVVDELPELSRRGRGLDVVHRVRGLGRGHVMGRRADAADSRA